MPENHRDAPVVVGIDGSKAAVRAALWAADEAVRHETTLLLVHVIGPASDDRETSMAEAEECAD